MFEIFFGVINTRFCVAATQRKNRNFAPMALSVQHLTKVYGSQRAVDDLSFTVNRGEVLGFLGPNGAGKSTTMKIATGYLPATAGSVTLETEEGTFSIAENPMELRKRIGYLPEHNPLYLDMYVHEFLDFAARIHQVDAATRTRRTREVIDMTGLGREQHKKIGALSKGYRQRVGLSQALIHSPEVLILDEPTTGLDPNQIVEICDLIREIGRDKTVIFSSHILSEVEAIANRIVIINRGKMVANTPTSDIYLLGPDELVWEMAVANEGFAVAALDNVAGLFAIEAVSPTAFVVRAKRDSPIQAAIFEACVAQQNALLRLSHKPFTLENAFRLLTT